MRNHYTASYYKRGLKLANIWYKIDWSHLNNYIKNASKITDIGCGDGRLMSYIKSVNNKADLIGIDTSVTSRKMCKKMGFITGKKLVYKDNDLVFVFHVLEHIKKEKQRLFLKKIFDGLRRGGFLIIRIPNPDCIEAKISKDKWFHNDAKFHCGLINLGILVDLLKEVGFKKIKIKYDVWEYRQTLLYTIINVFGVKIDKKINKIICLPFQFVFVPLSLLIAKLFRNSGTVEIICQKY